ncbi:CpXC domain-containing protein [Ideonella alba]|uniref:CpXC domain-containing protein n=1 Tax=Ideonella alba TaxID=2824118 RepID=UPI001FFD6C2E|nr:CpXC domain-containing protein [Ideonella alba]
MSIFRTLTAHCSACGGAVPVDVVLSVNADRRPDLREAILDNSFQMRRCPGCGSETRLAPQFHYLDQKRGRWIAAWPRERLGDWEAAVEESHQAFDEAFGAAAPAGAQAIGRELSWRVTFGWPALREKVLLAGSGVDDVLIEMVKLALIRAGGPAPLLSAELRLLNLADEELVFGWQDNESSVVVGWRRAPRALLAEIDADPDWVEMRGRIAQSPFADATRLFMPAEV